MITLIIYPLETNKILSACQELHQDIPDGFVLHGIIDETIQMDVECITAELKSWLYSHTDIIATWDVKENKIAFAVSC